MLKKLLQTERNTQPKKVEPYQFVSLIYSDLMKEVNYKRWAKYIYNISGELVPKNPEVLELASGSCILAKHLSKFYPEIICTDLSLGMLKQGNCFRKVVCDMTSIPFSKKFDLIISTFDSVNYILSAEKLLSLFCEVKDILDKNGIFTFDVSLEKNSFLHQKESKNKGRLGKFTYRRESVYDSELKIHKNTFFISDKSGNTYVEEHKQKIYPFNLYFELLEKAGLYAVNCYESFTRIDAAYDMERVQFIVKRK